MSASIITPAYIREVMAGIRDRTVKGKEVLENRLGF